MGTGMGMGMKMGMGMEMGMGKDGDWARDGIGMGRGMSNSFWSWREGGSQAGGGGWGGRITFALMANLLAECASGGGTPRWLGASSAASTKLCSAAEASGNTSSSRTCNSNTCHVVHMVT